MLRREKKSPTYKQQYRNWFPNIPQYMNMYIRLSAIHLYRLRGIYMANLCKLHAKKKNKT